MIIRNVIWYGKNPSWFSPRSCNWLQFCLEYASGGPKRSIHGIPVKVNVTNDSDKDNPAALSGSVAERAQKICRLVSTNPKRVQAEISIGSFLGVEVGEVSPLLVLEVLRKLSNAGLLALGFFRWAEKQKGFNYTEAIYNSLVDSLGKIRQFDTVWVLVESMREKGLLSKDTFMLIIRRYAIAKRISEALKTFEKMEMFGLRLDTSDFNKLIDAMTYSGQVEKAQRVFDTMKKKFPPDCKTYSILLEGWGDKQNLSMLNEVYREMREEGIQPDAVAYGTMINAFCKARKLGELRDRGSI